MSVKSAILKVAPSSVEHWLRDSLYRRNCKLEPSQYRAALEQWYKLSVGRECNLDDPKTFGEKLQWLKLYDSTPLKGKLADKFTVREWVADKLGRDISIPCLGDWKRVEDIDYDSLPDKFVLKATHGSKWNVIVEDKSALDIEETNKKLAEWLTRRTAMSGGFEMHYEFCEPRIIAEQYMADDSGGLRDYKFVAINGEVQFVLAIEGRFHDEFRCVYYTDWTKTPFTYGAKVDQSQDFAKPESFDEMLGYAKILSEGFPFVRVDFYEIDGKPYFGEMTFTPANGLAGFSPESYDLEYGNKLILPEKKPFKGMML
ncbi:MAG: glycosyl transferase [Methanosphaera sp. rholeuAM270]|nr:MAG: glycosyl transferase [Methanosphaera sp. rholeuAM270]